MLSVNLPRTSASFLARGAMIADMTLADRPRLWFSRPFVPGTERFPLICS
jgi:hypothetical protein